MAKPFQSAAESGTIIQIRRGDEANLPADAAEGELLLCLDSKKLFTGLGAGVEPSEIIGAGDASSIGGTPIAPTPPVDGEVLVYDGTAGQWIPADPVVSGPDAPGVAPTRPPVQIGLVDSAGHVQRVSGTPSGAVSVAGAVTVGNFPATQPVSGAVAVSNFPATQPISAAALPLPAGAATEASLGTDGAAPPAIAGTGIRGWLRAIYQELAGVISVAVSNFPALQSAASSSETGTIFNGTTALTPKFAKINASGLGTNNVLAAVTGKKIRVLRWDLTSSGAVNAKFQSNAATDISGLYYFGANGGISAGFSPVGHFQTNAGETLDLNLSAAVAVGGTLTYVEV
jgi:hypothetical protein